MNAVTVIKNKDDTMLFRFHSETNVIYLNVYTYSVDIISIIYKVNVMI